MKILSEEQVAHYQQNGFVLAKGLIAPMGVMPNQRLSSRQRRLGLAFGGGDDVQAWLFLDFSSLDCSFWFVFEAAKCSCWDWFFL